MEVDVMSEEKFVDDGGLAFPGKRFKKLRVGEDVRGNPVFNHGEVEYPGMSLRDWLAGQALAGICASGPTSEWTDWRIAKDAYNLADAMIKARKGSA